MIIMPSPLVCFTLSLQQELSYNQIIPKPVIFFLRKSIKCSKDNFWEHLRIALRNAITNFSEWISLRRFLWIWPLLFSIFMWESAKSLGFRKVALSESFVLLGCLNSMTVQAQTVDWNEVGLKNSLCSPYPVSDPQVSRTLPLSPLPLSPFAWANCGGKVKGGRGGANTGVMNPPHRQGDDRPCQWSGSIENLRTMDWAFSHGLSL